MRPSDRTVDHLVDAILDGTPADWAAAEGPGTEALPWLGQLKVIAAIAAFHRSGGPIDESWGHLRLIEPIGRGSFGDVYRAWDTRLDREVALKLLPASTSSSDGSPSAFIHEGRLLARVSHPNIVTIYGAEQIADQIGLWMEFIRGETLEQALEQRQRFSTQETIAIGLELSRAIAAVHHAGLLHRDIKPQNVMRTEAGRVVLMDFGTGRELDDDAASDLTGTPLYLAPEILEGQPATVQSDIYSLDVLLYHLITASYPVRGRTVRDVRRAHEQGERTAVRAVRRDVPSTLARVIERAIDPRPEFRYATADALGADLAQLRGRPRMARLAYAAAVVVAATLFVPAGRAPAGRAITGRVSPTPPSDRVRAGSSEVDELCLRGFALVGRRGILNAVKAAGLFAQAIEKDPASARAHAGLSLANAFVSFPFRGVSFDEAYPIMRRAAHEALRLDSTLAEAHAAAGWVYAYEHDWASADLAFKRAIALNPGLTQAYTSYSVSTLQPLERYDEALRLLRAALQHDPSSLDVRREIGEVQLFAGQYDEAVATFHSLIDEDPDFPFARSYLAKALILLGRVDEALPLLEPGLPFGGLARAYVVSGRRSEAEKLAVDWQSQPYLLTVATAALGDADRAVAALERSALSEPHRIGRLLIEPELIPLRDDPRVVAIKAKAGLR